MRLKNMQLSSGLAKPKIINKVLLYCRRSQANYKNEKIWLAIRAPRIKLSKFESLTRSDVDGDRKVKPSRLEVAVDFQ